ncbi:YabP/YqfC family sporulation protein [Clostridioides difficile]|uniref:YabP/YqfC family sporulation protein n=1 Tax=Clostridioides difficile TaxID=1496 RepID=UPI0016399978|nr:YabP/YqfC family sporulation protein [Clostridioides difficile]MDL0224040.1 YabP/YqfC family sporulation protein [Clostridioides difficile]HBF1285255.1 YabP/YqfC family sporulation protein [Clostridioides difficile]HBF1513870.1 YabP/YqfC family sporulation protein [Clostridioides difficile]HBF2737394.1 YabP/YqfC family sporulation protein [Clostridioides difficile]HBH0947321.1 YabP/YqfC family sporulation protein [Clostridioides difficile]
MLEISTDLQVNQPVITVTSNTFISIENYLSILEYEVDLIRIKTKVKTIKISGYKLSLKYITDSEIGIKGIIYNVEYVD